MGYVAQIVAVPPAGLRERFLARPRTELIAATTAMLAAQGLEDAGGPPGRVVDMLLTAIETQPLDARAQTSADASTALYLILDTLRRDWDPCYHESWNFYPDMLAALARVMSVWSDLLQTSLSRGLFGLRAEEWPFCGWISPDEIRRVVPSFVEANREAYLTALKYGVSQRAWYAVQDDLQRSARDGRWIIHSYG